MQKLNVIVWSILITQEGCMLAIPNFSYPVQKFLNRDQALLHVSTEFLYFGDDFRR